MKIEINECARALIMGVEYDIEIDDSNPESFEMYFNGKSIDTKSINNLEKFRDILLQKKEEIEELEHNVEELKSFWKKYFMNVAGIDTEIAYGITTEQLDNAISYLQIKINNYEAPEKDNIDKIIDAYVEQFGADVDEANKADIKIILRHYSDWLLKN